MVVGIAKIGGMMQKRKSRQRVFSVAVAFLMLVMSASAVAQQAPLQVPSNEIDGFDRGPRTYIVMMSEEPAGAYRGGTAGFAATRPASGTRIDVTAPHVRAYRDHLRGTHDAALASVGGANKVYDYGVAFNGFAAVLTGAQAAQLARIPGVVAILENEKLQLDTLTTPDFLGLSDPGGAWSQRFVGDRMIIGVVDSGIRPESPSFSATPAAFPDGTGVHPFGGILFRGICQTGEQFEASDCSNKLVGARFYHAGFGTAEELKATIPYEYVSPLDVDGHGTHTASTAGGNWGVPVEVNGGLLGHISGMAPRARVAAYKACWGFGEDGEAGCFSIDTVAAIDQAVADGVDVINYSISGTNTNFLDPVEVAFLFAADAGVFVAASAGNDGPGASTVAHPSPWVATVAAGTHDRVFEGTITLGNGQTYEGASLQNTGTPSLPMVYSGAIPAEGATVADAALCFPGTIDPAQAAGKMVVCDRGVSPRVEKSQVVADAGGLAMVLVNVTPNTINADIHAVPSIHVDDVAGAEIKEYVATDPAPTGSLSPGVRGIDPSAPQIASFSSRGPLNASGDVLKPDITAPGVDVLAAYSPDHGGRSFDFLSGTSMSSPHIAGIAAVIMSAHRSWSPAMVRSALMTTAADIRGFGPFDEGSGQVTPNSALQPGLVYDADFDDYVAFLCGTGQLGGCDDIAIDPSDLNTPNIAIGALAGSQTITRTVTNVGSAGTFRVRVQAPRGVNVTVSPTSLVIPEGGSASYTVTFERTTATLGRYAIGSLQWADRNTRVRSVIAVLPVQLAAPEEVLGSGTEGSVSFEVAFGYTGPFTAAPHGLVAPTRTDGNVIDDPANDINTALATGVGVTFHDVTVPAGTEQFRVSLFNEFTDGNDDLDLYVFGPGPGFPFVGGSGSGTSDEQVDVFMPAAGDYVVVVHGWGTDGPDANYTLFHWLVSGTPADGSGAADLSVTAPGSAVLGTTGTVTASWDGLVADEKYLGGVSYTDGSSQIGFTTVAVSTE
jgi:hypothetical protein